MLVCIEYISSWPSISACWTGSQEKIKYLIKYLVLVFTKINMFFLYLRYCVFEISIMITAICVSFYYFYFYNLYCSVCFGKSKIQSPTVWLKKPDSKRTGGDEVQGFGCTKHYALYFHVMTFIVLHIEKKLNSKKIIVSWKRVEKSFLEFFQTLNVYKKFRLGFFVKFEF